MYIDKVMLNLQNIKPYTMATIQNTSSGYEYLHTYYTRGKNCIIWQSSREVILNNKLDNVAIEEATASAAHWHTDTRLNHYSTVTVEGVRKTLRSRETSPPTAAIQSIWFGQVCKVAQVKLFLYTFYWSYAI